MRNGHSGKSSIRFKLSLWFTILLILVVGLAFFVIRFTSGLVLQGINRDYLISTVEKNAGLIAFTGEAGGQRASYYVPYEDGFLEIDEDFLGAMGSITAALYKSDGTLLYGESPLSKDEGLRGFEKTMIWRHQYKNESVILYDRRVDIRTGESLWLRGMVSETASLAPLTAITRLSLILLPILILLAVLFVRYLTERMLSPLNKVEETARQISQGNDLNQRIEGVRTRDEVGSLAESFNRMLDRLEKAFERERRFTSDASHELRTPTSVILAQTEYTLERERSAAEYKEALEVVARQGNRMKNLISDMLDYSRMDLSAERFPMERCHLSALIKEEAEALAPVGSSRVRYETDIEEGIYIKGNEGLLARLLQNLVSNAYRYGRPDGCILVELKTQGERCALSVEDDGAGIPREEQERIFDRFYRGDQARSTAGTGLGLSLVQKIAELHEAELLLESEEGRGSRFSVLFKKN